MQESGPITTEDSKSDGRLKVSAGCSHGKSKCLKCAIKKKDGVGGIGFDPAATPKLPRPLSTTSKPHRASNAIGGVKKSGVKSIISSIKSLNKKMKFPKVVKSLKVKSLKSMLKSL